MRAYLHEGLVVESRRDVELVSEPTINHHSSIIISSGICLPPLPFIFADVKPSNSFADEEDDEDAFAGVRGSSEEEIRDDKTLAMGGFELKGFLEVRVVPLQVIIKSPFNCCIEEKWNTKRPCRRPAKKKKQYSFIII
jgi:hypothetical protein